MHICHPPCNRSEDLLLEVVVVVDVTVVVVEDEVVVVDVVVVEVVVLEVAVVEVVVVNVVVVDVVDVVVVVVDVVVVEVVIFVVIDVVVVEVVNVDVVVVEVVVVGVVVEVFLPKFYEMLSCDIISATASLAAAFTAARVFLSFPHLLGPVDEYIALSRQDGPIASPSWLNPSRKFCANKLVHFQYEPVVPRPYLHYTSWCVWGT